MQTPPARCADLIPTEWSEGVEGEPIPPDYGNNWESAAKSWAQAFIGQTGQLSKANDRTTAAIGIFRRCEVMVNEARP